MTATWTLENLKGTIANGTFTPDPAAGAQAGLVKAAIGSIAGAARVRVDSRSAWTFDFEIEWRDAAGAVGQRHRQVRRA